jgi:hypothetical protein
VVAVDLRLQALFAAGRIRIGKALLVGIECDIASLAVVHGVIRRAPANVFTRRDFGLDPVHGTAFGGGINDFFAVTRT